MCKIAGGYAVNGSFEGLGRALNDAPQSLVKLSKVERHGSGTAALFRDSDEFEVNKQPVAAHDDASGFRKDVNDAEARGAYAHLGHVRWATQGRLNDLNTHPFTNGRFAMVMNGNIQNFQKLRETFLRNVNPELRPEIKGDTDSELAFYLFLSVLGEVARDANYPTAPETARALKTTVELLVSEGNKGADIPSGMNALVAYPNGFAGSCLNRELSINNSFGPRRHDGKIEPGVKVDGVVVATLPPEGASMGWDAVPNGTVIAIDNDSSKARLKTMSVGNASWFGPVGPRPTAPEVPS